MMAFAGLSLAPAVLLLSGAVAGGWVAGSALFFITVIIGLIDRLAPRIAPHVPDAQEFPAADHLSVTLALVHLAILPLVVWALSMSEHSLAARLAIALGAGLWFGQVSNANAHELIHRSNRRLFGLGALVYISLLFGHHTSAHRLVHHRHVATLNDPNTAFEGETYWGFFPRAWAGSFKAGWQMENALRARVRGRRLHPYALYLGGGAAFCLGMGLAFGPLGLLVYLALCLYSQAMLMLSDYVQHYGLERARMADGRPEPVSPQHSWNAPRFGSSAMMLNAPLHSDHHTHPSRPYPMLEMQDGAPRLPFSLPVMGMIAMIPPFWFRMMDPRLRRLREKRRQTLTQE
jgi:alkane 1-monooxygenase